MRSVIWDRREVIDTVRRDIWRHLSPATRTERDTVIEAARLLQMRASDIRTLAQVHFVLSREVGAMLDRMPFLIRRLSRTTTREQEASAEKIRGAIAWGQTLSMRAATGLPHLYVTTPTRRAFDTPENELLVFALDAVARFGRLTGWAESTSPGVGETVRTRINEAVRWGRSRALSDLPIQPPSPTTITRVRAGRRRQLYRTVLAVNELYQRTIARLDRTAIRQAVERHALVTRDDPVLLELLCAFTAIDALREQGWRGHEARLLGGGRIFRGKREGEVLDLYYQKTPVSLKKGSLYGKTQLDHGLVAGELRPDLVVRIQSKSGARRWLLIEVKGIKRSVSDSARAATLDLLAYRRAFERALSTQELAYGLGVAWGAGLQPVAGDEILLCSPDTLPSALDRALASSPGH